VVILDVVSGAEILESANQRRPFGTPLPTPSADLRHWEHEFNNQLLALPTRVEQLISASSEQEREEAGAAARAILQRLSDASRHRSDSSLTGSMELNPLVESVVSQAKRLVPSSLVQLRLESTPLLLATSRDDARFLLQTVLGVAVRLSQGGQPIVVATAADPGPCVAITLTPVSQALLQREIDAVRGIAAKMQASLALDTASAGQSRFRIRFDQESAAETDSVDAESRSEAQPIVLLVDDQVEIRHLVSKVLTGRGFEVLEAQHGPEALALLARFSRAIDLLITDLSLPEISGVDLSRAVRALYPKLPVLFISGRSQPPELQTGERTQFLMKPFRINDLASLVQSLLQVSRNSAGSAPQN